MTCWQGLSEKYMDLRPLLGILGWKLQILFLHLWRLSHAFMLEAVNMVRCTLILLRMLKLSCISMINFTGLWCIILLIYSWILFDNIWRGVVSIFMRDIGLHVSFLMISRCFLFFHFLKWLCRIRIIFSLDVCRIWQWNLLGLESCKIAFKQ